MLRLAERSLGPISYGAFSTLDDIACAAIRAETPHLGVALRQPVVRLQTEIVQSGRPFIVALGDVYAALGDLVQRPGYDQVAATREIASSCAAMSTLAAAPGALVLSCKDAHDPIALAGAVARHFGLALGEETIAEIAGSIGSGDDSQPVEAREPDNAVVTNAIGPYAKLFRHGGELEPIVWQPDLFFTMQSLEDASRVPARGAIDITGRARFLIFGPYINLVPGAWAATVALGFSAETSGMSFVIEVCAGAQLAYTRVQPIGEQVIEANLSFTIPPSIDQPVEIRVLSERAAFDGRIVLGHVRLARRVGGQSETEQRLIAALRS